MQTDHKSVLARAIVKVLRPLIRVLIRNEVTHAELTELVRQTYVEIAYKAYSIPNQEMTYSRVAVLTGLSRKEVVRLKGILDSEEVVVKNAPNRAQRVVHGWLSDKDFLDAKKQPKDLVVKGTKSSFQTLVQRYSGDITYGAVLDELNLIGVTELTDTGAVRLVNKAYIPHRDEIEKVRIMSECVSDLFESAVYNIEDEDGNLRFQRQMVYSGVEKNLAEKFKNMSSEKATKLLESLSKHLSTERDKSTASERATGRRVGLGIYYFESSQGSVENSKPSDKTDA